MKIALAGNQNCGKTTLFNALTGANQHVGNFPGVTVARKSGGIKGHADTELVDLPGIYSIRPFSSEETVTRDFLLHEKPDGIINVVDATNTERNLYLTLQLLELHIPMIVCLNMMDEVSGNGGSIDTKRMSLLLGVPVLPVSAAKNEGVRETGEEIIRVIKERQLPAAVDITSSEPFGSCIRTVKLFVSEKAAACGVSPEFCSSKIIEGDESFFEFLGIGRKEKESIEKIITVTEERTGLDRNTALAVMRYDFIENVCHKCVVKGKQRQEKIRSERIDRVLTGKYTAFPLFLLILLGIFYLTFNVIGSSLSDLLSLGTASLTEAVDKALSVHEISPIVHSLITDGILTGVGSVIGFLPIIIVLFFFLSVLEDTGYMTRIAFIMDIPLRKIGLSGKSFVPMLIGFGCTVPAAMAARTLTSERDRKLTVLLLPFMSCSAKIPIYAVFSRAFFPGKEVIVMMGLYLTGIIFCLLSSLLLKKTVFHGDPVPFIMELPDYRLPSARSVLLLLWEKAKDFLGKAFTIIFVSSIVIWFLQSFDTDLHYTSEPSDSLLSVLGKFLLPVFRPLGFTDWRIPTSLLSGFPAKEAVISTLSVLLKVDEAGLSSSLSTVFSPVSAISFLVFSLLYTPCAAAIATVKRELSSVKSAVFMIIAQTFIAWCAAYLIYSVGSLFM